MPGAADFSLADLYAALDVERQTRGITWRQMMQEINAVGRWHIHPISDSTVRSLRTKAVGEGDGILQMLRWLKRAPESFVPGCNRAAAHAMKLPDVPAHEILRFDTRRLYQALDAQRTARHLTWQEVAQEIGRLTSVSLTNLKKGGRVAFPQVVWMTRWLDRPVADFVRASPL